MKTQQTEKMPSVKSNAMGLYQRIFCEYKSTKPAIWKYDHIFYDCDTI